MKILLTGFGGWGGDPLNPALKLINHFKDKTVEGATIYTAELPVNTRETSERLEGILNEVKPDIYIGIGSAPGRSAISVERVALNILDFPIPDNEGNKPIDVPVYEEGPVAYYSSLPIKAIYRDLQHAGIPSVVSNTAGTYVCNQTMYSGLHFAANQAGNMRAGFIHVPLLPEQQDSLSKNFPSMMFELQAKAIETAIQASIQNEKDIEFEGGAAS